MYPYLSVFYVMARGLDDFCVTKLPQVHWTSILFMNLKSYRIWVLNPGPEGRR